MDIKALKLAQDAGEIEVERVIYNRRTGLFMAGWRPITPLPFLNMEKYRKVLESRMKALFAMEPTEAVVEEYNLLSMDMT